MIDRVYHDIYKRYLREAIITNNVSNQTFKADCSNEYHGHPGIGDFKLPLGGIAPHLRGKVVCLEIDREKVEKCRKFYPQNEYKDLVFMVGDVREIPFSDDIFDVVLDFSTLDHIPFEDGGKVIEEYCRVLKPEGLLRLVVWINKSDFNHTNGHVFYYSDKIITNLVEKYFKIMSTDIYLKQPCMDFKDNIPDNEVLLKIWRATKIGHI